MKKITLIRHAKVDLQSTQKIDSLALQKWVKAYDTAPIEPKSLPPKKSIDLAKSANVVLTSTLRRTKDSANVLQVDIYEQNALFNEAAIPKVNIPFLKFKPTSWLVILRVMLLFGIGKKDTSLKASKLQAKKAAKRLLTLSNDYEHIVLVGHGGMNWLIGKELEKEGWSLEGKRAHGNWDATVFQMGKKS